MPNINISRKVYGIYAFVCQNVELIYPEPYIFVSQSNQGMKYNRLSPGFRSGLISKYLVNGVMMTSSTVEVFYYRNSHLFMLFLGIVYSNLKNGSNDAIPKLIIIFRYRDNRT